jgi:hypothetical protein
MSRERHLTGTGMHRIENLGSFTPSTDTIQTLCGNGLGLWLDPDFSTANVRD